MHVGVYFSLKGTVYANNSGIPITHDRAGEWYFPGGIRVPILGIGASRATTFYRNRGDNGMVNLNRVSTDVMSPTGLFCCMVPDATDVIQRACANIGE